MYYNKMFNLLNVLLYWLLLDHSRRFKCKIFITTNYSRNLYWRMALHHRGGSCWDDRSSILFTSARFLLSSNRGKN